MAPPRPHFFKIMMGDFSKHLRIPPAFLKYIPKGGSQWAILVGPSGGLWQFNLSRRSSKDLYVQGGWEEFVKDHSLQEYDFLLFRYNGDMHFKVQIFDETACEREDAFTGKASQECGSSEGRKKRFRMLSSASISSGLREKKSNRTDAKEDKKGHRSVHGKERINDIRIYLSRGVDVNSSKSCGNMKVKEEEDDHEEDGQVFEDYQSFTSQNPFFMTKMSESNIIVGKTLTVPARFHTDYLPLRSSVIILRDPKGRSWEVRRHMHI